MQQVARFSQASAHRPKADGPLFLAAGGYAYGLGARATCRFRHAVSHGGGLPGFGSTMFWLPEHGVALVGLANLRYAGWGGVTNGVLDALFATGALKPRVPQPSPALLAAQTAVDALYDRWDDAAFDALAAENLALDTPREKRRAALAELRTKHGACKPGSLEAENALRGTWTRACETGEIHLTITLAPTRPPKVQHLEAESGPAPAPEEPCKP